MASDKNLPKHDGATPRAEQIESYRVYLNFIANRELDRRLRSKVAPSDVVQQTMMEAFVDWTRVAEKPAPEQQAWLRQILRHNLADARRTFFQCAKRDIQREAPWSKHGKPELLPNHPATRQRTASSLLMAREELERLEGALGELSSDQRQVVVLRSIQGHAFDEVGRRMNRSGNAARKLWARAIERLAENLHRDDTQRE